MITIKTLSESDRLLKKQFSKNFKRAIKIMSKESKEYNESEYRCGFSFMNNGSIVSQMYYGTSWVYSKEKHFIIGNSFGWKQILFQESMPLFEIKRIKKTVDINDVVEFVLDRHFSALKLPSNLSLMNNAKVKS